MKKILKTKFAKKQAKGFSLVEVLCAVVLLALVATPILQALYSGMVVNNKSRKMLAAADLASETTEFISSLAFEDFTYTDGGTTYTVPGLKSYYWGGDTITPSSCKLSGAKLLYPGGPHARYYLMSQTAVTGWTAGKNNRTLGLTEVKMDGYEFYVKIETKVPSTKVKLVSGTYTTESFTEADLTNEKYFCYNVTVSVYDKDQTTLFATTSTTVPNKF